MSDTEFQILWCLWKEQIYSRTFTVLFLEILSYSGVDTTPRLLSDISILFTGISNSIFVLDFKSHREEH